MKLSKVRLKQIIKEEIGKIEEMDIETISDEDVLGTTVSTYDVGSPEAKLNYLIRAGEDLAAMSPEEQAEFLQNHLDDEAMRALAQILLTPGASLASVGR